MTAQEAENLLAILSTRNGAPDSRSWGEQFVELSRIARKGSDTERAQRLHLLYRCAAPLPETHELMIARFEEPLFAEMGKALRKKPGQIKAELHRGQPAFGSEAPYRDLEPLPSVSLPGWDEAGGFHLFGGRLSLGETPSR